MLCGSDSPSLASPAVANMLPVRSSRHVVTQSRLLIPWCGDYVEMLTADQAEHGLFLVNFSLISTSIELRTPMLVLGFVFRGANLKTHPVLQKTFVHLKRTSSRSHGTPTKPYRFIAAWCDRTIGLCVLFLTDSIWTDHP